MTGPSTPADVDALFELPLGEFTAARNALVARLKKAGRHAEADATRALAKPSVSAWVVNQLYWRHRESFDRLIATGDRLRRAQSAHKKGGAARDPSTERRELVAELAGLAAQLARDASHSDTRDLIRRVTSTLEALSSYGKARGAPVAGRLTHDLEPVGFEAVLGFLPAARPATKRPSRAQADEDRKRLFAARKAEVRAAERALGVARKHAARAAIAREAAAARARTIEAERARVEERLTRISRDAGAANAAAREAALHADRATQARESAERALERARGSLKEMASSRS